MEYDQKLLFDAKWKFVLDLPELPPVEQGTKKTIALSTWIEQNLPSERSPE